NRARGSFAPPNPPPRVQQVARTERSPGFGSPSAFPPDYRQWLSGWSKLPVTVAGPRRTCTGFRASAFAGTSNVRASLDRSPPRRKCAVRSGATRKRALEPGLELGTRSGMRCIGVRTVLSTFYPLCLFGVEAGERVD